VGTNGDNVLIGGAGNDSLQSGNFNDTMLGGTGNDVLTVSNFATTRIVDGGDGTDLLAFASSPNPFTNGVFVDLNKTAQTVAAGVVLTLTTWRTSTARRQATP
jgi:Ca2+-binding RTX toxin-like protein